MKLATRATIIIDMHDPDRYGYPEPTMKSLIEMLKRNECTFEIPDMFDEPVYTFTQK